MALAITVLDRCLCSGLVVDHRPFLPASIHWWNKHNAEDAQIAKVKLQLNAFSLVVLFIFQNTGLWHFFSYSPSFLYQHSRRLMRYNNYLVPRWKIVHCLNIKPIFALCHNVIFTLSQYMQAVRLKLLFISTCYILNVFIFSLHGAQYMILCLLHSIWDQHVDF